MTFSLPLSTQAASQLEEVQSIIQDRQWDEKESDVWQYSWGSAQFRSKKVLLLAVRDHGSLTPFLLVMVLKQSGQTQVFLLAPH